MEMNRSNSVTVYSKNTINRIRLTVMVNKLGNIILQNHLMNEIKKIGPETIEEYLEKQKQTFYNKQKLNEYFYADQFNIMYPGGFNGKTKTLHDVSPTNSVEKFDFSLCNRIFPFFKNKRSKVSIENCKKLCKLRNELSHDTKFECNTSQMKRLHEFDNKTRMSYDELSLVAKFELNAIELQPNSKERIEEEIEKYLNDKIVNLIENDEELFIKVLNHVVEKNILENNQTLKDSIENALKVENKEELKKLHKKLSQTLKEEIYMPLVDDVVYKFLKLEERVDQVDERVDQVDKRVDQVDERVDQVDEKLNTLSNEFNQVQQSFKQDSSKRKVIKMFEISHN